MGQGQKALNAEVMKSLFILFFISSFCLSCKGQKSDGNELNRTDYEVLGIFLEQVKDYSFVDKHFFNENLITNFIGKFKYHQNFQRNADSICKFSKEIDKRKFYCPLADEFSYFEGLLDENDLNHLNDKYSTQGDMQTILIDSIIGQKSLKTHSENYYQNMVYEQSFTNSKNGIAEYPSVRIQNLYFNKNESIAIVAYSIFNNSIEMNNNYFILKKMDDVWWKPLGSFKL